MSRTRRSAQVGDQSGTSSRTQSSRAVWNRERFTSRENARWYEEMKNNALVLEKTVSNEVDRRAFDVLVGLLCLIWQDGTTLILSENSMLILKIRIMLE